MNRQAARRMAGLAACILLTSVFALATTLSAQSRRNSGRGITVFEDPGFRGDSASFGDETPDLRAYGLNDKISSIEVPNGETWQVCQDINFGNRCQTFSGSISDLREIGWNDRISSLRRVGGSFGSQSRGGVFSRNRNNNSVGLVFYDQRAFRGNSMVVDPSRRSLNARVGSVAVRGGTWELCDRSGRCTTVDRDVPDLSRLGLDGRIASARLIDGSQDYDRGRANQGNGRGRDRDNRR